MRLYAARKGHLPASTMAVFEAIASDIDRLPELEFSTRANCHAMAHAFARVRNDVTVVDGHFQRRNTFHSWLTIGSAIIDVHPVGGGSPFIVDSEGMLNPWNAIYIPDPQVISKVDADAVRDVERLIRGLDRTRTSP